MKRRDLLKGGAALAAFAAAPERFAHGSPPPTMFTWERINIGASGFSIGLDIQADGNGDVVRVVKTDTVGAWVRNATDTKWRPCFTTTSLPADDLATFWPGYGNIDGCWEIAIAPGNVRRLYAMYGPSNATYIYRSDDQGVSWTNISKNTSYGHQSGGVPNSGTRGSNQLLAIDPNNPDVVYASKLNSGLWRTLDAGATWNIVSAIPVSTGTNNPGHAGLVFDTTSGTTTFGGVTVTKKLFAPTYGKGVWLTTDGGNSFRQIADGGRTYGGPKNIYQAQLGPGGLYFAAEAYPASRPWKYASDTWSQLTSPANFDGKSSIVAVHSNWTKYPGGCVVMFAYGSAGAGFCTTDGGTTWVAVGNLYPGGTWPIGISDARGAYIVQSESAPDDPLFAMSPIKGGFACVAAKYNPVTHQCELATGFAYRIASAGAWESWANRGIINYTYFSQGMEQLIPQDIISPPGGAPVFACMDQPIWYNLNTTTFPSDFGPCGGKYATGIVAGRELTYCAGTPTFVAASIQNMYGASASGTYFTNDGGASITWSKTTTDFPEVVGCIAVNCADTTNFIGAAAGLLYYTLDQGTTWHATDGNARGVTGWYGNYGPHTLSADSVRADTFYALNTRSAVGLWRSIDKGRTFSQIITSPMPHAFAPKLRSVPGHAGHLFLANGVGVGAQHPQPGAYLSFIDVTSSTPRWTTFTNVGEPYDMNFGAPSVPGGYPAVYIIGWAKNSIYTNWRFGIWRSDDAGRTWVYLGQWASPGPDFPFAMPVVICGDMNTFGKVYVGINGSAFMQGSYR